MKIINYNQAIGYLEGFIGKVIFKVDPTSSFDPLERMRILLNLLGNPQDKFKSVLVGGTSGKGSTAYLISHILTTSSYKTGLTLSPHLQKMNERLQINGQNISDERFVDLLNSVIPAIKKMEKMEIGAPSYFEILIAMAFLYFSKEKVDIAVVEVGMGGEFDATNTVYPLVAVLTNVSLDHTDILGKTVQKIAKTKAGIIKKLKINEKELIVVSGVKQPAVIKIIEERCNKVGAKLYRLGKDFKLSNLKLSLFGEYQKENASLAIETVRQLADFGFKVTDEDIEKALSTAFFPGRFEVKKLKIKNCKLKIVLDGAHNPTKMKAFISSLKKLFPKQKKVFLVAFKNDKDIKGMLRQILEVADEIVATEFQAKTDTNLHASASAEDVKSQILNLKSGRKVMVEKDSGKALKIGLKTVQQFNAQAIIVVTGSLYLVGEIRNKL